MPNLNADNSTRTNSFYVKEIIYGGITSSMGILLTGLSISSVLCFYDNTNNSKSFNDKLNTFLNVNNLAISLMAACELNIGLDLATLGRRRINQAFKGLRRNISSSSQITEITPLLTSDIEDINNSHHQEINSPNATTINVPNI
ncbi:hypothetical protein [Spiroplasma endosymbiont of Polydrusus pterygomalis]|uniref:hypothetical protein n=1 Tax=Spiroplasma endosymbiont of Polydrusus pterygomalis TaxID=3139327 RepID=UPI003CCB651C